MSHSEWHDMLAFENERNWFLCKFNCRTRRFLVPHAPKFSQPRLSQSSTSDAHRRPCLTPESIYRIGMVTCGS